MFCRHFDGEGESSSSSPRHTSCVYLSSFHSNGKNPSPTPSVDAFFGAAPSESELQNSLTTLQQVFGSAPCVQHVYKLENTSLVNQVSSESETDWKEPSLFSYNNPRMLQPDVSDKLTFAIHLLQSDACVQRMVKSLSSDKSVWDAVLNNEAVRELKNAITAERDRGSNGTVDNKSPNSINVFTWISGAAKAKLVEAIEKITKIVKKLFQSARNWKAAYAGKSNSFKDKLRVSVMLSIMIFLMVVVDRFYESNSFDEKLTTFVYSLGTR